MAKRPVKWKKGDWLYVDEESGLTRYASDIVKDAYGKYVTRKYADPQQPQEFVKADDDPKPVPYSNPGIQDFDVCNAQPFFVGNTTIRTKRGPASAFYDRAIGEMEIGCSFVVR